MRDMRGSLFDFSPRGWGRVWLWTVLGTLCCVSVALYVDSFNFPNLTDAELTRAILVDIFVPTVLASPMLLFFTSKLRELAVAHHELSVIAATDSLTAVLNRGAFTALVDGYLAALRRDQRQSAGALLVVDADNFKAINDSFGHDHGDEALRIIARTIKSILRSTDLVGRIGGEEFGIFLPGSSPEQSEAVAERIRQSVSEAAFAPNGEQRTLSVSVGGVLFDRGFSFGELFRVADQQLYAAKQNGRNRVAVSPIIPSGSPLAA
jgi:diguanylate cyclase (GGDEF)-like protein